MITSVGENEYDKLLDVWISAVRATHHFLSEEDYEFYKIHVPIYFNHLSLFAYKDDSDNILGFLGVSEDGKIEMLFVHNDSRRKGIGKSLMDYAINDMNSYKVDVNEQNTAALKFYYHLGFKEVSRSEYDGEGKNYPILHLSLK